jgi:hypothetical protein
MTEHLLSLCYAANRTNKPVGKIVEIDGVIYLIKSCKDRHFLRQPPAIAYDCSIIDLADSYNVQYLLVNSEGKAKYKISLAAFKEKSFKINRGFGPQLACTLENWASTYTENRFRAAQRAIETPVTLQKLGVIQPCLFDSIIEKITPEKDSLFGSRIWIEEESFRVAQLIS